MFIIYVVLSCVLLFNNNPYQQHVYMTSAGKFASSLYEWRNGVTSYFHLRDINEDLHHRNAQLELDVIGLREQVRQLQLLQYADTMTIEPELKQYSFKIAHVINNSFTRPRNYVTIDKGAVDGIEIDMGVLDQNGVVGIVCVVSENNARIMSILNPDWKLSCKIKGSDNIGSLAWDGKDYEIATLEELPRHAIINVGDTIVTSGNSSAFPEGIPVGTIISHYSENDDNFRALKIKLLCDFTKLGTVRVVGNSMRDEIKKLEKSDR